jgi:hypothetical protein
MGVHDSNNVNSLATESNMNGAGRIRDDLLLRSASPMSMRASKRPFRQLEEGNIGNQEPSLKRICHIRTFSVDDDELEALVNDLDDQDNEDTNNDSAASSSNTRMSHIAELFFLATDSTWIKDKAPEMTHQRASNDEGENATQGAWTANNACGPLRYVVGRQPRSKAATEEMAQQLCLTPNRGISYFYNEPKISSPPHSQTPSEFPPIITPEEGQVLIQSPTWDLELQSILSPNQPPARPTGAVALAAKPSQPPFADDRQSIAEPITTMVDSSSNTTRPDHSAAKPSEQGTDHSQRLRGPFSESMKPIIRILLYLEQTTTEKEVVQEAFDIVQNLYDQHKGGEATMKLLTGSIFESLVEKLGHKVDLASVLQAAQSLESPILERYFLHKQAPRKPRPSKPFFPTLLQIAVAYGAYASKMSSDMNDMEEFVQRGAKAVGSMNAAEKIEFWKSIVEMLPQEPH